MKWSADAEGLHVIHRKALTSQQEMKTAIAKPREDGREGRLRNGATRSAAPAPSSGLRRTSIAREERLVVRKRGGRKRALGMREPTALVADASLSHHRVARELDGLIAQRVRSTMVVSDNGTELTSTAILHGSRRPASTDTIASGSLCRTASSKASTAAYATSCLNETMFRNLAHAREVLSDWTERETPFEPRPAHAERVCK